MLVVGFAASGLAAGATAAGATVASGDATAIATALASPTADVTGASFVSEPGGTPNGTSDATLTEFPTDGSSFGILTTGDVNSVPEAGTFASTEDGGGNVRGNTDFDVSVLKVDVDVPNGSNCLAFDFKFLSEEYPHYVGSDFDDAFIAELDNSTWSTSGSTITAPNNFAFDGDGNVVSVNSTGIGGMTAAEGAGTAFDSSGDDPNNGAATGVLHAFHQVTAGAHSLYFSIFDQGDQKYDSAVFLDNLRIGFVPNPSVNCAQGATPVTYNLDLEPPTASNPVGTQHSITATLTDSDGNPVADAPVDFTVTGANPGTDTETTDDSGVATLAYTGTNVGEDQISACYDADSTPPCEAVASASADWTPAAGLDVQSALSPNPVTEGDNVVDDVTITATDAANHNVVADVTSDVGGTVVSATPSQGSCDAPVDNAVSCSLGDVDNGASATIQVVVNVPNPGPESGSFSVSTTATSDEVTSPGVTSSASTSVSSSSDDSVSGYVPPGGSINLGPPAPGPGNPQVASFTLPDGGPGAQMTLDTETAPPAFCGGKLCHGDLYGVSDFAGYTNPRHPAVVQLRIARNLVPKGLFTKLYERETPDGPITLIPYCGPRPNWTHAQIHFSRVLERNGLGPHSGYAVPSPCVNAKKLTTKYLQVQILVLSGDPKIGFR